MAMLRACDVIPRVIHEIRLNCAYTRNRALTVRQFADLVAWSDNGQAMLDWPGWRLP
jgi:hypothetical protein